MQGRKLLEKYNCIGCHQVRPGVYDFKPSKETLAALERTYQNYASNPAKKDHVFPGHNAWTGLGSPWPDRLTVYGTEEQVQADKDTGRDVLGLRLIEAMHFTNNDGVVRDVPAGTTAHPAAGGRDRRIAAVRRGLRQPAAAVPEGGQLGLRQGGRGAVGAAAAADPRRASGVQPKWLYQFLLNPDPVRPTDRMKLRMPKFNMSGEEAMTLVNYFGAADKLSNPGAGLTYPYLTVQQAEEKYWRDMNEDYRKRLASAPRTARASTSAPRTC